MKVELSHTKDGPLDATSSLEESDPIEPTTDEQPIRSVVVIILNFNGVEDTIQCVESLSLLDERGVRIVVLDNGSSNDVWSRIQTSLEEDVRLLRLEKNVGVAAGWNVALGFALREYEPEFVFLLNNDAIVERGVIDELVRFMSTSEYIGAAGPSIMKFERRSENQDARYRGIRKPFRERRLSGCALLIKKDVFDDVGFFDEQYFAYAEEADFLERMNQHGWRSFYVPTTAKVFHKRAHTSSCISGFEAFHRTRNRLLFAGKNLTGMKFLASIASFFFKTLPLDLMRDLSSSDRTLRIKSRARGFVEGTRLLLRYKTRSS